ncbi:MULTISPECIES: folate-binding protein YgfZ [Sphingobium]|jgi:folate-binding protein YgfZ|nr:MULTISPECIES: folate-binding protein YgfZ [Sphingobium]AJR25805.1 aminomethyltransferase [Sphingobium sp. YBL2]PNQ04731.1 aminomethyltransferase [Sphingobium sp. SA916]QOT73156.1 folate-binding protein YgfZ [Sphingobium fuliginis]RYM01375.1 folate-binding protein [Sphingobium fuliginis]UXC92605.1 folate-binding protein YgfZ [Sphingobium sp. RSMS]
MTGTTLTDRALLRISGEEAKSFLQGLLTRDVLGLKEGEPRWTALLTPQGKALFDFILWADGEDVLIDCEASQAEALAKRLTIYRLRRKVAIARADELAVHWALEASGKPFDPRLSQLGHRWIAPPDEGDASAAFRAHRLSLGIFEGVGELGQDQILWLETNAGELGGVDYDKGCYVGQENTARMHYRNKVNRRLVAVPLAQADEKRQKAALADLGLSIELRRVEDVDPAFLPGWLAGAVADQAAG